MLTLGSLIRLQVIFAALSISYLLISLIRRALTGEALSAAAIGPSIAMFVVYLGVLYLPHVGHVGLYRIGMISALILFGGGGVIGNVMRYADSGLENYASTLTFAIAVAINFFGTVLNIIALLALFTKETSPCAFIFLKLHKLVPLHFWPSSALPALRSHRTILVARSRKTERMARPLRTKKP